MAASRSAAPGRSLPPCGVQSAVAGQGAGDLADAVGAEVEADAGIFVADGGQRLAAIVHANEGHDEFVGHTLVVGIFHALHRVDVFAAFAIAEDHGVEGLGNALPAAVAVHGVVASVDGSDLAGVVLAHLLLQLFQISGAVGGQGVAAIHEGVHEDAVNSVLLGHLQQARRDGSDRSARRHRKAVRRDAAGGRRSARSSWRSSRTGCEKNSPFWIISSMRVLSMCTMRPAPMLRWPTSLLPICPSGRPT